MASRALVLLLLVAYVGAQANKKLIAGLKPKGGACSKKCPPNNVCEEQICHVCVPEAPTCKSWECKDNEKCEDRPTGPVCVRLTCADIFCAAGELCNELPDGPDCVPDVPTCEGFYCRRGTNCYVRNGSPICLPNTCEVRVCEGGLTCVDTPNGALCRRGKKTPGCKGKYCPENSKCIETPEKGAHCVKI
ncbi:follistatin-like domain-containing protein DDB_G0289517 [Pollicipes pollicipes]|uniref:follistatin-like domain-containing protein DDB_G0289517 n=1 Tax=Pollicipes pollicipes TaxID=41117 RepID=UPI0018849252|nr:follistatin-like domain-containing protein DDB_G0289517 [Pollicipes pollicipes]